MPGSNIATEVGDRDPQPRIDPITRGALRSFKAILAAKYGPHLRSLYLFGSRARGDHRPDSDIDIAVFLDEAPDPVGEQFDLIERGYDIVLDTGVNIQPWVFAEASLSDPAHHRAAHLVRTIRREGVRL
jgi:predicted nucleotidyltransferase